MRDREISGNNASSVAIAGCGAICSVGKNTSDLLIALKNNTSGLRASERFSHPRFQSNIVGAAPIDSSTNDPALALASSALHEAMIDTYLSQCFVPSEPDSPKISLRGVTPSFLGTISNVPIPSERIGLVLSTTKANIEALERVSDGRPCSDAARRHLQADLLANNLATSYRASEVMISR